MSVQYDVTLETHDVESMMERFALWTDNTHLDDFTRETFGEMMRDSAQRRFDTESNRGASWEPLHSATIRRRQEQGFPGAHPINVRTGRMKSLLIHSRPEGGPTGDGVEFEWPERVGGELYMKMLRAAGYDKRTPARPVIDADESHVEDFIDKAFTDLEAFVR